jgi:hypothetical protein
VLCTGDLVSDSPEGDLKDIGAVRDALAADADHIAARIHEACRLGLADGQLPSLMPTSGAHFPRPGVGLGPGWPASRSCAAADAWGRRAKAATTAPSAQPAAGGDLTARFEPRAVTGRSS